MSYLLSAASDILELATLSGHLPSCASHLDNFAQPWRGLYRASPVFSKSAGTVAPSLPRMGITRVLAPQPCPAGFIVPGRLSAPIIRTSCPLQRVYARSEEESSKLTDIPDPDVVADPWDSQAAGIAVQVCNRLPAQFRQDTLLCCHVIVSSTL